MRTAVVIPNWNGEDSIAKCLGSLIGQVKPKDIIVVDNGSVDNSVDLIKAKFPDVTLLQNSHNLGFAGGVNVGIKFALDNQYEAVALFNNDAIADKAWLANLTTTLANSPKAGIVTSKIVDSNNQHLDSTGDLYTTWGLPYPRGRGEPVSDKYDQDVLVFGASGGASLYRSKLLGSIGLFDQDFFAYYEDVDLSFRAQLAGWKIIYQPKAIVYHEIGATSGKIKGFTTYQTIKNLPMLMFKNVPAKLLLKILPRFCVAYTAFIISAVARGQGWVVLKGLLKSLYLSPKKLYQRWQIQSKALVSADYIESILVHDLPPNARKLRQLRKLLWRG